MATTTAAHVSVEEYLRTSYEPDVEYVDGQIEERNVGEIEHSELILALSNWFLRHAKEWRIRVLPDVRTQVTPTRFRIPDIVIAEASDRERHIVRQAPLIIIEVLSPEDRISRYQQRIADYRAMGVRAIWVVDPESRHGWDCSTGSWIECTEFRFEQIHLNLPDIFVELQS